MYPALTSVLPQLPRTLHAPLSALLADDYFPAMLTANQIDNLQQASGLERPALALALLPLATAWALHTEISHFQVGAIACGLSGNFYFGANMEFPGATLGQTMHAEQSAISHAWMRGERGIDNITVNYSPCGHCRQFMNELNSGLSLVINQPGREGARLGDYLPDAFGPDSLDVQMRIFDKQHHGFTRQGDSVIQQAIAAANRSHTPYSHSPSGVAIETCQGKVYCGSYAENAALNPSLPPLQVALNLLTLSGDSFQDIQRVVLAESLNAPVRQWQSSLAILNVLGCQQVEQVWLYA